MSYHRNGMGAALLHEGTHAETPPTRGGTPQPTVSLPPPQPAYGTMPTPAPTSASTPVLAPATGVTGTMSALASKKVFGIPVIGLVAAGGLAFLILRK